MTILGYPFARSALQEECVSYASIMVYVEADRAPERRVQLAASLAHRFNAALTGMSALAILPPLVIDGRVLDEMTGIDVELMKSKLAAADTWFRDMVHNDRLGWRSALDHPGDALVREARYADLVVIGNKGRRGGAYRTLDTGEAVLRLGRPALVVPNGVGTLRGERVVIGWKDTRESRRAVRDAIPFLQQASQVIIVEACGPGEQGAALGRLEDIAGYLAQHRIKAGSKVLLEQKGSGAEQLLRVAEEEDADLLVTGGYGHSRLGELIFGGMTRELLASSPICCLMSH
jgi:nucleotide-binding universal stress UspA family protein